jgi:hypothetical protein
MRLPLNGILEQVDIEVRAARASSPPYVPAEHLRRLVFEAYQTWNNFIAFDSPLFIPTIESEVTALNAIGELQRRLAELAGPTPTPNAPKIAHPIPITEPATPAWGWPALRTPAPIEKVAQSGRNGDAITLDYQRAEHGARFRLGEPRQADYVDLWRYEERYFLRNSVAVHDRTPPRACDFVPKEQAEAWLQKNPFARLRALCINFEFIYSALKATNEGQGIRGSCALEEIRGLTRRIVAEGRATSLPPRPFGPTRKKCVLKWQERWRGVTRMTHSRFRRTCSPRQAGQTHR